MGNMKQSENMKIIADSLSVLANTEITGLDKLSTHAVQTAQKLSRLYEIAQVLGTPDELKEDVKNVIHSIRDWHRRSAYDRMLKEFDDCAAKHEPYVIGRGKSKVTITERDKVPVPQIEFIPTEDVLDTFQRNLNAVGLGTPEDSQALLDYCEATGLVRIRSGNWGKTEVRFNETEKSDAPKKAEMQRAIPTMTFGKKAQKTTS